MKFFDFNFLLLVWPHVTASSLVLEAVDESWPNRLLSAPELPSHLPVSDLRRSLPGQSLRQRILLLGSVPLLGLRSTHLSRKSPRYRGLSARPATQALSHGLPGPSFSQYLGTRQRASRLAHLCRFRSDPDCHRPRSVSRRTFRSRVVPDRVCLRLHNHRFMPSAFSVENSAATRAP